jgi:tRNA pseudouridine38-40 synthase
MQYNKDAVTIEGVVRDAIVAAGGISESNADAFQKVGWSRAARTDKGVSAVGQVVALRMLAPQDDMGEAINERLPPGIRVFGVARVTAGFDARKTCDRRRYEYILPEFAFDPNSCRAKADSRADGGKEADAADAAAEAAAATPPDAPSPPFVFDDAAKDRMTAILRGYEGTHNFHNFTVRLPSTAPSATRYILSFECAGTVTVAGETWVRLVVVGQSFVLHQIRKMVGTALAVARGAAPPTAIADALRKDADVATPMAPELGLFLDETVYASYNKTWGAPRGEIRRDAWGDAATRFKLDRVYPHIAARDGEAGVNAEWLRSLNERNFRFSAWATAGRRTPKAKRGVGGDAVAGGAAKAGRGAGGRGRGRGDEGSGRGGEGRGRGRAAAAAPPPPPSAPAPAPPSGPAVDPGMEAALAAEWSD